MAHRTEEEERARHHRDHVAWLHRQASDLQEHRRSASMRDEEDYAVGSEVAAFQFESVPSFSMSDEEPVVYRSLDMPSLAVNRSVDIEVVEDDLVYRSLPALTRFRSEQSSFSDSDADATWLAAGRPPLIQRQQAFNRQQEDARLGLQL